MLETAVQSESDPPETVTSASTKSVEASERVRLMVAVSPTLRALLFELMDIVGLTLSLVVVSVA